MSDNVHISRPRASELHAGGYVSGSYRDVEFHREPVKGDAGDQHLWIGNTVVIRACGFYEPHVFISDFEYTPPEPQPWWETCPDDWWIEWTAADGHRCCDTAARVRSYAKFVEFASRNPRRVLIADADTEVIVPKAALEKLQEGADAYVHDTSASWGEHRRCAYDAAHAARAFLAAVDERGES